MIKSKIPSRADSKPRLPDLVSRLTRRCLPRNNALPRRTPLLVRARLALRHILPEIFFQVKAFQTLHPLRRNVERCRNLGHPLDRLRRGMRNVERVEDVRYEPSGREEDAGHAVSC